MQAREIINVADLAHALLNCLYKEQTTYMYCKARNGHICLMVANLELPKVARSVLLGPVVQICLFDIYT